MRKTARRLFSRATLLMGLKLMPVEEERVRLKEVNLDANPAVDMMLTDFGFRNGFSLGFHIFTAGYTWLCPCPRENHRAGMEREWSMDMMDLRFCGLKGP